MPTVSPHVSLKYEIKGEGETGLHAETIDGCVKSESFKVSVGNRYIKEKTVIRFTGEEIISRLKYPTKTTTVLDSSREPFFFVYKNRRIYTYSNNTQNYYVDVGSVEIYGVNVKTKGTIRTFSSGGMDAVGSFIMELKFSEDFNTYMIVSEKYDIPQLIRMPLE